MHTPTPRAALLLIALAAPAIAQPADAPLRELPGARDLLIGAAAMNHFWSATDATEYARALATHFNALTPENQMKPYALQPERGAFRFDDADRFVAFAKEHRMTVHGHTLVWHMQNPAWLEKGAWSRPEALSLLSNHVTTVVSHFRGDIPLWDVVNEAMGDNGQFRESFWVKTLGDEDRDGIPDYIDLAFRFARKADPNCTLIYNDYGAERSNAKADAILKMMRSLKRRGTPIDAVGFQFHIKGLRFDFEDFRKNARRFASAGFRTYITEADFAVPPPVTPEKLEAQARLCRDMVRAARDIRGCGGVFWWGLTDRHSWLNSPKWGEGGADGLLLDREYQPKPAYRAVQEALR